MNRRHAIAIATTAPLSMSAAAGVMDWFNGARLGAKLPEFDTEYLGVGPEPTSRLLLIDFWATWCAPCREEFPHLNRLSSTFSAEGLAVVGLTQEPVQVAKDFMRKVDIQYPVGAAGNRPLQKQLAIKALPYAVLVNRQRAIIWRGQGSSLTSIELAAMLKLAAG